MATLMRPVKIKTKKKKEKENNDSEYDERETIEPDEGELNAIIASLNSLKTSLDSRGASEDEIAISLEDDNICSEDQRQPLEPDEEELNSILSSLKSLKAALDSRGASKDEILIRREKEFLNHVSPLGDIRLTEEQRRQSPNFERFLIYKWRNSTIPYKIQESDYSPEQLQIINNAISEFDRTNLHLVPYNEKKHRDFVYVYSGKGYWSYLGRIRGKQKLSLQSIDGFNKTTVLHEFMHAAGFIHEHNRSDRDDYVKVLWDNIEKEWQTEYVKVLEGDILEQLKYDYSSVMHYPYWSLNKDGIEKDAFEIKDTSVDKNLLGEGRKEIGFTEMDIIKINNLYPNLLL